MIRFVFASFNTGRGNTEELYIPHESLYCDEDGYVSVKGMKPASDTCIFGGKQVNVGNWTLAGINYDLHNDNSN